MSLLSQWSGCPRADPVKNPDPLLDQGPDDEEDQDDHSDPIENPGHTDPDPLQDQDPEDEEDQDHADLVENPGHTDPDPLGLRGHLGQPAGHPDHPCDVM